MSGLSCVHHEWIVRILCDAFTKQFVQVIICQLLNRSFFIQYFSTILPTSRDLFSFTVNYISNWPFFILKYFSVCDWLQVSFDYHITFYIDVVQCITISINQTRRNKFLFNLLLVVWGPCQHFAVGFMGCGRYQLLSL